MDVEDELYTAPPDRFTAARDAAVAEARAAGDASRAKDLAALRKPTVAAWVVNLLALKRPDLVEGLVELASSMRQAQRELRGADLRKLTNDRKALVKSLVEQARDLALAAQPGAKLPLGEVETTLNAALSDENVAGLVRSGRLLKTTSYEGFGEMPVAQTPASRPGQDGSAAQAQARAALAGARRTEAEARQELDRAASAEREAESQVDGIEAAMDDLRQQLIGAKADLAHRREAHRFAQRRLAAATREVAEIEAGI